MKIGIDISQIVYEGTGVSTYTKLLVKTLVENNTQDNFVLFGSALRLKKRLTDFTDNLSSENIINKFSFLPPKSLEYLWNWLHVAPIEIFTGKLDVFHTSDWLEPPGRCPKVTTIHDLAVYKFPQTFQPRGGHDIVENQRRKLRLVNQDKDTIIAVSENTKKDIVEILKIPERRISVVYEAADPIFTPQNSQDISRIKEKYNISGDYLLCVGTREPRKNLSRAIEAYNSLNLKNYQLVIAGKYGWGDDEPKNLIRDTKYKVLGYVPNKDLVGLYSGAVAFIMPSLYEGFGLPILEAMACGCPVITSNIGSMKEVAGRAAILVDPREATGIAEAIEQLLNHSIQRDNLIVAGLDRVKNFSWEKTAVQTMSVYRTLVGAHK